MVGDRVLAVARGDAEADLVFANGSVVNVFTGEILRQDVAVVDGVIAAVGESRAARETLDLDGSLICPGLIDAHVHVESSMVAPLEYARAVVPHGTTTVIADPHEIANVAGIDGVRWLLAASADLPLDLLVTAPSCVPATHLSTSGASLDAEALAELRELPRVVGLAEVMNVPGVVLGDAAVRAKIETFDGLPVDGHAPTLSGGWLNAYCAAGVGSDHESVHPDEAAAKLRMGMRLLLREGSAASNLVDLLPAVTPQTANRCAFASDDRHPHDLLERGHVDDMVRLAIGNGLDPVTAIQMATLNAAETFRLFDRGAIAPGRRADLLVCDKLEDLRPSLVLCRGRLVARDGAPCGSWPARKVEDSVVCAPLTIDPTAVNLRIPATAGRVRVIGIVPGQVLTESLEEELPNRDGCIVGDPNRDIVKLSVLERHRDTGNVGLGFVRGLGLRRGAIAGTVAHDHHNLVVAGADDRSMLTAIAATVNSGGGLVAAEGTQVVAELPLPLGGLMSRWSVERVRDRLDLLLATAHARGCTAADPFMLLSFLALEVIPALKLTDQGLVDVERFEVVPLAVG